VYHYSLGREYWQYNVICVIRTGSITSCTRVLITYKKAVVDTETAVSPGELTFCYGQLLTLGIIKKCEAIIPSTEETAGKRNRITNTVE
jgi:hypothetical protein